MMPKSAVKLFNCDVCDFKGKTSPSLSRHKTIKHKTERIINVGNSKKNVKVVNPIKNPVNQQQGMSKQNLNKRQKESFKCDVCDSTISTQDKLDRHMELQHQSKPEKSSVSPSSSESSPQAKSSKADNLELVDMNKTTINPDLSFLTDTANGIGTMLDSLPPGTVDIIGENVHNDEDKEDDNVYVEHQMELLQKRLMVLRDDDQDTLVPAETDDVEKLGDPKTLELTLANLRKTEVEHLREKINKMELKIDEMVTEKDCIKRDLSNFKEKYETECKKNKDTNIKLEIAEEKIKELSRDLKVSEERRKDSFIKNQESNAVSMPDNNDAPSSEIHKCNVCKTIFNTKSEFIKHKVMVHKVNENFKCDICNYEANSSANLVTHIVFNHSKQQSFENKKDEKNRTFRV